MEDTYNTKAIILRRVPYRESDLMLTIYTPDYGKKTLIARGSLKQGAKLAGHLEPLTLSDLMIVRGKKFEYVGSASGKNFYLNIKDSLEKLKYASIVLKAMDKYTREDDDLNPGMFYKLIDFLDTLEEGEKIVNYDILYISFLFKILFFLGLSPNFYECVTCKKKIDREELFCNIPDGGIMCLRCFQKRDSGFECFKISSDCLKIIRFLILSDFSKIKKLKVEDDVFKETSRILNSFYNYHL